MTAHLPRGLLITFLPVLLLPVLARFGFANTTFPDADFGVIGILLATRRVICRRWLSRCWWWRLPALLVAYGQRVYLKTKSDCRSANSERKNERNRNHPTGARYSRRHAQILKPFALVTMAAACRCVENSGGSVRRGDENRPCRPDCRERDYFGTSEKRRNVARKFGRLKAISRLKS